MAGRRRQAEEKKGLDVWIMTYGDMMSLLLVFFVLIVSFSTIQETKFHDAAASLRGAFGLATEPPTTLRLPELAASRDEERLRREVVTQTRELEQTLLAAGLDGEVDVEVTPRGVAIRVNAPFLFASGHAELRPEAAGLLERLAGFLGRFAQPVRVEGHTDSVPIRGGRFASNWELSAARAVAVARTFQGAGVAPGRLSATGYGEFRPAADNGTAEGRQRNRRVEILLEWAR